MRILFVCTGNTCRSPMAEALFRQKLKEQSKADKIQVRSAGLYKFWKIPVSSHAITVLAEYGIQCNHKPQRLSSELIEWADLVLTMTRFHKYVACLVFSKIVHKTFTLKEFVGEQNSLDIKDPFGKSLSSYRQCAQEIERALNRLLAKVD